MLTINQSSLLFLSKDVDVTLANGRILSKGNFGIVVVDPLALFFHIAYIVTAVDA
jgi:hypothetical protein